MAEYIKFRLTAAKVSVSMAFLALLGGLAAKTGLARSGPSKASVEARKDKWLPVLSFKGLPANLQRDLKLLEGAIGTVYDKDKKALQAFSIKLDKHFYNKSQANLTFLKFNKARLEFLGKDATAANAAKLGGMPAGAFFQGTGFVGTGAVSMGAGSGRTTLLAVPGTDGEIIVVCQPAPGAAAGLVQVLIHNGTSQALPVVQTLNGQESALTLKPGGDTLLATIGGAGGSQLTLQTLPTTALNRVITLTISGEQVGNNVQVVGQALNGDG